ncbi:prepilin-type N-terminal cleavage/methylation domain-containing protein [Geminisphaera colitermitum]|uniref:prepilin-type N-terminal cleavage/methylation domain-containing protein n=1 Tax=Geminisphaera colitermitum TaxID=1148786 RepID=UPI000158D078|nr:prepilin-type N-terminal cleavage/methylation domain-containing protein [Geminisphaera colitermitum]
MKPRLFRKDFRTAFTLIELLTVIAIIGILTAILIPTVGKVRESARAVQCASNLRQIQLASISYANDHRGSYVPVLMNDSSTGTTRVLWYENSDFLAYFPKTRSGNGTKDLLSKALHCPTALSRGNPNDYTYGANVENFRGQGDGVPGYVRGGTMSTVARPSQTMAFVDALDWQVLVKGSLWSGEEKYEGQTIAYRHGDKANLVFFDGHTARLPLAAFEKKDGVVPLLWKILE